MKYYLIAGEASGDLHGSNLIKSIIKVDENAEFRYYGGDKMLVAGGSLVQHYRDTAIMGFLNVALNASKILRNMNDCKEDIASYAPDILILIDYPGFNLEIAKYAKTVLNLTVIYYIPPKIWAWKPGRVEQIKKYIDKVYCIFPFEVDFYKKHGYDKVEYVGNPCVQSVSSAYKVKAEDFYLVNELDTRKKIVALLPGSRKQEVERTISLFNDIDRTEFSDCQFVLAGTSAVDHKLYNKVDRDIHIVFDQTYPLLSLASAAVVNSGTATLETALFRVPQVVVYPVFIPRLLYYMGRKYIMKLPYISLVNIISGEETVKELVAHEAKASSVIKYLKELVYNEERRDAVLSGYEKIATTLGDNVSSDMVADDIRNVLRKRTQSDS